MRTIVLATATALVLSFQMAASVQAEGSSTTIIKKHDDINLLPVPHPEENKVIIHKDSDD
jgi:hypothetical protein